MTTHQTATAPRPAYMGAYIHTRDNLIERYALHITLREYEALCDHLSGQDLHALHPCVRAIGDNGRLIIRWRIYDQPTVLVFCPRSGLVVTALPSYRTPTDPDADPRFVRRQERHRRAYKRHGRNRWRA